MTGGPGPGGAPTGDGADDGDWTPPRAPVGGYGGWTTPSAAGMRLDSRSSAAAKLGPEARSVVVPAALTAVIGSLVVLGSLVLSVAGLRAAADYTSDPGSVSGIECAIQRRAMQNVLDAYEQRTGRPPASEDVLDLEVLDSSEYVYDFSTRPPRVRPRVGSPCVAEAELSLTGTRSSDDPTTASDIFALLPAGLAGMGVVTACWWLACAYRCMPARERRHPVGHAFRPVRVGAVSLVALAAAGGVALGPAADEPLFGSAVLVVVYVATIVAGARAALRVIDMIGDVTFVYRDGQYGTSRLMRICVKTILWSAPIWALLLVVTAVGDSTTAALLLLAVVCVAVTAGLVGTIAAVVAVVQVTTGIETTLRAAAAEHDAALGARDPIDASVPG